MSSPDPDLQPLAQLARSGAVAVHLGAPAALRLRGPDVRRWASGMFTNHVQKLPVGHSNRQLGCDDRGRIQFVLRLAVVAEDELLVLLEGGDPAAFLQRYQMVMVLDDIEAEPVEDVVLVHICGPAADQALASAGLPVPRTGWSREGDREALRHDRTGLGGVDLLLPAGAPPPIGLPEAPPALIDALRVRAGRAAWPADGTDRSLAHELGLQADACAFDKGCYVGQEVLNRLDVRGGVQKRLTAVRLDGPVPPGAAVTLGDDEVGALTSLSALDGEHLGIGVLRKAVWEPGTRVVVSGVAGEVVPLPRS